MEGRLLPSAKESSEEAKSVAKFSQFVKSVWIEVPPSASRAEKRVVEWSNASNGGAETDGFELTVPGQSEVKVKILIVINHQMQLYVLAPTLARLLGGVEAQTHEQVLRGVWLYCQKQKLETE